jgi:transposase-like protein
MTFVSLAQACRRLGIDAKTVHRWLTEAQLPLQNHPHDGRKKGVSEQHLMLLARLHQRHLAGAGEPVPAEPPGLAPALPASLLALPEQITALQMQIAALQQQVADLTGHLTLCEPAPVLPPASTQLTSMPKRPPRLILPAPRSRPAAKPQSTSAQVIPRVEYGEQGRYVVICPKKGVLPIRPDSEEWFAWLTEHDSFRFVGQAGYFTAHHEWRVKHGAWRAHRHIRNHSYTLRLAPAPELTIAVLEQAAQALQAHLT